MKFKIPIKPLTVNKAWQGRRFKTKDYKQYERDIKRVLKRGRLYTGRLSVGIRFFIRRYTVSDVDNFLKPLLDILTKLDYWVDDRQIKKITIEKFKSKEEYIEVEINEIE